MQYYSSFNNLLEKNAELTFTVTDAALSVNNQMLTLVAEAPIEDCLSLDVWVDDLSKETDGAYVLRELSYSTELDQWSSWNIVMDGVPIITFDDPTTVLVRVRLTMIGTPLKPLPLNTVIIVGERVVKDISANAIITLKDDKPVIVKPETIYKIFKVTSAKLHVNGDHLDGFQAHFRYSQDSKRSWTKWIPFTEHNFLKTKFSPIRFTVFEFGFKNTGPNPVTVVDIVIEGDFINVTENYTKTNLMGVREDCKRASGDCGECSTTGSQYKPTEKTDTAAYYKPYNVSQFNSFYNYMNQAVSDIWGHPVKYYRLDPDENGSDYIVNEHQLYNIVAIKDVKVVVPRNQFPENKNNMQALGLAFLDMFEIHVTKEEFKKWFGIETRPGQGDFLLFCDINKMFLVDHVAAVRKAMNLETYYRITLKTYSDKKNVKGATKEIEDDVQSVIAHAKLGMLLADRKNEEIEKVTKPTQYKPLTAKKLNLKIDAAVKIITKQLLNSSLIVAEGYYDMPIPTPRNKMVVSYGKADPVLNPGDNRAISLWFKLPKYDHSWVYTLVDNYDEKIGQGYRLRLIGGKLVFNVNDESWELPVVGLKENTWYCALVNFGQREKLLSISLYNRQHEATPTMARTSTLVMAGRHEYDLEMQVGFEIDSILNIGKSERHITSTGRANWYATNLRIFSDVITDEHRDKVLNEYIVSDEHLLILGDNCEKQMILPKAGNL
jgi:hypothetical protein